MKKFKCCVKMDRFDEDIIISATRNNRQWSTVTLDSIEQLIEVRDKINKYLASKSPDKATPPLSEICKQPLEEIRDMSAKFICNGHAIKIINCNLDAIKYAIES